MPITREQLEAEARRLPRHERVRLAEALIASLDEEAEIEQAWNQEVRQRVGELDAGSVQAIPGDEVFAELDDLFK